MSEEELRLRILARRARFVAASLAMGAVAVEACSSPQACLFPIDAGRLPDVDAPSLDVDASVLDLPDASEIPDAAADAPGDAGAD
jgi:hypothetical protein